jgi:5-methylcytosine-specific restriction endonuclease McrA
MEPVLVLNANFEPLNVCDMRRAIGLIILEKASMVENGRGVIQTIDRSFPRPSIIRLQRMIKRPRPEVRLTRREVFRRDHFTCQYCGENTHNLTIDHVLPRHLGGKQSWENVVTACAACNHKKGGRPLRESGMRLRNEPTSPPNSAIYLYHHYLEKNRSWQIFLSGW